MNKIIAIATAGCMLIAASAPAIAAPVAAAAPAAAQSTNPAGVPTIGARSKLIQRAAATPRKKSSKFLGLGTLNAALLGIGSLFSVAIGSYAASGGFDTPGSS